MTNLKVDEYGNKHWYNENGERHRDDDQPAVEYANGNRFWYQNGKPHRDGDQPAAEYANGDKLWYQHGKLHRDGGKPAIEYMSGYKAWYNQNDDLHGDNNKPPVEDAKYREKPADVVVNYKLVNSRVTAIQWLGYNYEAVMKFVKANSGSVDIGEDTADACLELHSHGSYIITVCYGEFVLKDVDKNLTTKTEKEFRELYIVDE